MVPRGGEEVEQVRVQARLEHGARRGRGRHGQPLHRRVKGGVEDRRGKRVGTGERAELRELGWGERGRRLGRGRGERRGAAFGRVVGWRRGSEEGADGMREGER